LFVSATSRGLKPLRLAVSEQLKTKKYDVVVQEEFAGSYLQIKDMIRGEIAPCDAVVLLVGPAYGFEPTEWPEGLRRCSYTQLEHELAVELGIPIYRYLVSEKFPLEQFAPEPTEHQQRQRDYVGRLKADDHIWYLFDTQEQLLATLEKTRFHKLVRPNLPFESIGTLFKGREDDLARVRRSLLTRPAHATAVTSKQAIHGLGGVGKTRFAVEYAHRYGSEYSARLYANADTPSALASNMATLVHVLDLQEKDEKEQAKQLEAVERWLRMHAGWLLILDNVDTAEAQSAVNAAFKSLTTGHVLITSRLTDWGTGVNAVELDVLSLPASTEFLIERTNRKTETPTAPARQVTASDPDEAEALAEELGRLALALEQAGAYICANRITFAEYRKRLTEVELEVLTWFDPEVMKYPRSVAVTWQASVRKLHDEGRNLLNLLCWLAPDSIPVTLIKTEPKEPPHFPIGDRERALRDLSTYSLARWNATGDGVTVHRLVQDVTRMRIEVATRNMAWRDMLFVTEAFVADHDPTNIHTWASVFTPAAPHISAVTAIAQDRNEPVESLIRLINSLAVYHATRADYSTACVQYRRALARFEAGQIEDPLKHGQLLSNLALSLSDINQLAEAEQLYTRAISLIKPLGDHQALGDVVNNLGMLLRKTGRLSKAERLFRDAIAIFDLRLVADDARTATSSNNLGELLHETGRYEEAETLYRKAVTIDESIYGNDHPSVSRDLNNLATLLQELDRLDEAEALLRRAAAIEEASYGVDHPNLAFRLNNLANILAQTCRNVEAEIYFRRALAIIERSLGPDHPDFAGPLIGLAELSRKTNRPAAAEELYHRSVSILRQSSGLSHSLLAKALVGLGSLFKETNRAEEAEPTLREGLAIAENVYGDRHPVVSLTMNDLACLLLSTGRPDEAEPLLLRGLAISKAIYGFDHPDVARGLLNLAEVYRASNRLEEAVPFVRQAISIFERSLGTNHPNVAIALHNLAGFLKGIGRREEAAGLYQRALLIDEQVLGPDHPNVAIRLNALAHLLIDSGSPDSAEPLFARAVHILLVYQSTTRNTHSSYNIILNNFLHFLMTHRGLTHGQALDSIRDLNRDVNRIGNPDLPNTNV